MGGPPPPRPLWDTYFCYVGGLYIIYMLYPHRLCRHHNRHHHDGDKQKSFNPLVFANDGIGVLIRITKRYDPVLISENNIDEVVSRVSDSFCNCHLLSVETKLSNLQAERRCWEALRISIAIGSVVLHFLLATLKSGVHWVKSDGVISGIGNK